ncbi:hypothetical protein LZ30DRAFT_252440 [Colletotrichum cereale]|nr:hypothetical protein LZ30DRAFT_252440 [Colletotrichum cereale]
MLAKWFRTRGTEAQGRDCGGVVAFQIESDLLPCGSEAIFHAKTLEMVFAGGSPLTEDDMCRSMILVDGGWAAAAEQRQIASSAPSVLLLCRAEQSRHTLPSRIFCPDGACRAWPKCSVPNQLPCSMEGGSSTGVDGPEGKKAEGRHFVENVRTT